MKASGTLHNIHLLRALAAMLVVLLHAASQYDQGLMLFPTAFGHAGVDLFFVISGFIMVHVSTLRQRGPLEFMRDRVARIVPIYWFFSALTVVLVLTMPWAFRGTRFEPLHTLASFLFVAYPNPAIEGSVSPILRVGWTLNYEMLFYAIFAIAMAISAQRKVWIATAMILALVMMRAAAEDSAVARFYTNAIMLEFVFGMLIGLAFNSGILQRAGITFARGAVCTGLVLIVAFGLTVSYESPLRAAFFGLPAAIIVAGALVLETRRARPLPRVLGLLGDASYVIYLSHPFVLTGTRLILAKLGVDGSDFLGNTAAIVLMCINAAVFGVFCHLFLERPVTRALKPHHRSRAAVGANV